MHAFQHLLYVLKRFLNDIFGQNITCCNVLQLHLRGGGHFKLEKLEVSFEHIHFCELANCVIQYNEPFAYNVRIQPIT